MEAIKTLAKEIQNAAATADEHLIVAITRTAVDLELFNILSDLNGPLSLQDLASRTGADPALLELHEMVVMQDTPHAFIFASSQTIKNLSIAEIQANLYHKYDNFPQSISPIFSDIIHRCSYDVLGPAYQLLPDFLASTKYQTPTDTHKAVYPAHPTPLTSSQSKKNAKTDLWQNHSLSIWEGPQVSNIIIEFRKRFPDIKGRVIFQDLPGEIEHAVSQGLPDRVEAMVHDFYTPQIIKGVRNSTTCELSSTTISMIKRFHSEEYHASHGKDSLILLDEMVLPNYNVDWFATPTDLTMLAAFGSMERTEAQWKGLLDGVGLKVRRIVTYTHAFRLISIIAASL
ncbi:hypothetical protein EAF00_007748 [Botryotinia globosa]|nr:hypothetical protein EAF00_007748 [Botryotinia globosa]